jgi:prevent-host-death family protein
MLYMETMTVTDARARFTELVEKAVSTHLRTTVTRNGAPAAVIISVEDYEAMLATIEVLSDPDTLAAIRDSKEPDAPWFSHEEARDAVKRRRAGG